MLASIERHAQLFRDPLEAKVLEGTLPFYLHLKAGPLQLDLFRPTEYGYDFKVIVTNKRGSPRKVVAFHEGRGSQEDIFAELKSHCQMDYVPVTTRVGNQLYMFVGILAHNLTRKLQMQVTPRARATTAKQSSLWCFREIATLRRTLIQRAGGIIRPAGKRSCL